MNDHVSVASKTRSILNTLRPDVTAQRLAQLSDDQWVELANRAGVPKPSPLTRERVLAELRDREEREAAEIAYDRDNRGEA